MRLLRANSGQSTAEYAVVIAIVLGAVIGMQTFVKRGLQGRYKDVSQELSKADGTGELGGLKSFEQYEPYYAKQDIKTALTDNWNEEMQAGDKVIRDGIVSGRDRQAGGSQEETSFKAIDNGWK